MKPYKNWRPTAYDTAGLALKDRQDWLVGPVILTRDSGALESSNWMVFGRELELIDVDGSTWEVHRFGHWGPGWFEIFLLQPGSKAAQWGDDAEAGLSDYPILDEEDHTEMEMELADETWRYLGLRDRIRACADAGISIFAARSDDVPYDDSGRLTEYLVTS